MWLSPPWGAFSFLGVIKSSWGTPGPWPGGREAQPRCSLSDSSRPWLSRARNALCTCRAGLGRLRSPARQHCRAWTAQEQRGERAEHPRNNAQSPRLRFLGMFAVLNTRFCWCIHSSRAWGLRGRVLGVPQDTDPAPPAQGSSSPELSVHRGDLGPSQTRVRDPALGEPTNNSGLIPPVRQQPGGVRVPPPAHQSRIHPLC